MKYNMKIGELAKLTQCQVETIRFYEKENLLPLPPRSSGNYRLYDQKHVERLIFIRRCRSLDMALDDIRLLLRVRDSPEGDCSTVSVFLDTHIRHIGERITELEQLKNQLNFIRNRCSEAGAADQCGILKELGSL